MANNSYAKSNKKSNTALLISIVSIFLALILCGVIIAGSFLGWFTKKEEESVQESGGMEITVGESNGISVLSTTIDPSDYATYGISETAESAVLLTATVTPEGSIDAVLDWSVAFVERTSEWATGKAVTDYVTVTPTSDGALTATVACYGAFGEQITVKASIRTNAAVYATCAVDYRQKFLDFDLIEIVDTPTDSAKSPSQIIDFSSDTMEVNMIVPDDWEDDISVSHYDLSLSETYTLAAEVEKRLSMSYPNEYSPLLGAIGTSADLLFEYTSTATDTQYNVRQFLCVADPVNMILYKQAIKNYSEPLLALVASVTVNGTVHTRSWNITLSVTDTFAETITFDSDGIEFGG